MKLPQLTIGKLVKRYKRFLADVALDDGTVVTAHVANTGSMKTTRAPGSAVALSHHPEPHRKLEWTLELVQADTGAWVCVNTMYPNRIVEEAVSSGRIHPLRGYDQLRREVPYGNRSRVDLLLSATDKRECYVEVKNVTYREGHLALFPDAVTERGTKHLQELMKMVAQGHRGVIFFLVNRGDCSAMAPAHLIDPRYSDTLFESMENGVEALAYRARITLEEICIDRKLEVVKSQ